MDEEQKHLKKPNYPISTERTFYRSEFDNKTENIKSTRSGAMDENVNGQNNKSLDRAPKNDMKFPAPTPRSSYVASFPSVEIRGKLVATAP